ncbi:MAG: thioredoxin family protein [Longimicrobiales bacterium]|nr:thioredoxin family protein [Longimicrobiales bacterium]
MAVTPSTMLALGTSAPDFALPDVVTDRTVSLGDFDDAPAFLVAFWCNHCPFVQHIEEGFVDFAREYAERGLAVVAIASNDIESHPQDGPDAMRRRANEKGYPFPYLLDETQEIAKAYRAACTPDFFLFDGERTLAYRGQFDGARPSSGAAVTGDDLRAAVDALLAGEPIPEPQRPSMGCNIKWKPGSEPEWFG